ncbi:MAG: Gfo/Idh/MocA family oxidoreductase [Phycisphaerae bacterium]|nr:Gfo/Idh/MocA family oxidoreductase [Phycisphaerae bacterium]
MPAPTIATRFAAPPVLPMFEAYRGAETARPDRRGGSHARHRRAGADPLRSSTRAEPMSLSLGIIGAGSIGTVHAATAARLGVAAPLVWDVDESKGRALAATVKGLRTAPSLDALLAERSVNAVVVATPNDCHAEIAVRALEAGKHVLLEKPMATTVEECDRILNAMRPDGPRLQMGFVYRHAPAPLAVKGEIDAGRIGRIYHAKCSMYRRRGIPGLGGWFTTRARSGGGPLIDLGVHAIDQALWLCGFPKALRASGACYATFGPRMGGYVFEEMWAGPPKLDGRFDVEDHATALVRFDGGLTIELNVTWAANIPDRSLPDGIALFGEKGGCRFTLLGDEVRVATEANGTLADLQVPFDSSRALERAFEAQLRAFRKVVEEGAEPAATAEQGRAVQEILAAIDRSSARAREVPIDARSAE